eukprot:jgi/Ulvmu1/1010/UM103_0038.1
MTKKLDLSCNRKPKKGEKPLLDCCTTKCTRTKGNKGAEAVAELNYFSDYADEDVFYDEYTLLDIEHEEDEQDADAAGDDWEEDGDDSRAQHSQ